MLKGMWTTTESTRKVQVSATVITTTAQQQGTISVPPFRVFFCAKRIGDVAKVKLEKDGKGKEEISELFEDILNFFFDGVSGMNSERLKRSFLILYTRQAHETFKDHEKVAESLKDKLWRLCDAINESYVPLGGSFAEPYGINVRDDSPFEDNVPITKDCPSLTCSRILTRASYAREIKCSASITVVLRVHEKSFWRSAAATASKCLILSL